MNTQPRGSITIPTVFAVLGAVAITAIVVTLVRDVSLPEEGVLVNRNANATACPTDAKLCPDGSAVGRTGPNCEFTACPGTDGNVNASLDTNGAANTNATDSTAGWKTYENSSLGFSFRYPSEYQLTESQDQYTIATVTAPRKSMTVGYLLGTLDPNNVQGVFGKQTTKMVSVGTQSGYEYIEGDAGCGGSFIQSALPRDRILRISFVSCEDSPNDLTYNGGEGTTILSTFRFTE